jgi:hypothetical protein
METTAGGAEESAAQGGVAWRRASVQGGGSSWGSYVTSSEGNGLIR